MPNFFRGFANCWNFLSTGLVEEILYIFLWRVAPCPKRDIRYLSVADRRPLWRYLKAYTGKKSDKCNPCKGLYWANKLQNMLWGEYTWAKSVHGRGGEPILKTVHFEDSTLGQCMADRSPFWRQLARKFTGLIQSCAVFFQLIARQQVHCQGF